MFSNNIHLLQKLVVLFLFALILQNCDDANSLLNPSWKNSGVVLTFDDTSVGEWIQADSLLSNYDWKATFCVGPITKFHDDDYANLLALQNKGHEIAAHGLNHLNAVEYIDEHSIQEYLDAEILPELDILDQKGLKVNAFAYPQGTRNAMTDSVLFNYFDILRGTTYSKKAPEQHHCYYVDKPLVYGLGIDANYGNDTNYIIELLRYAEQNDKYLILYCHKPVEVDTVIYTTSMYKLEAICSFVKANGMRFKTLSELGK